MGLAVSRGLLTRQGGSLQVARTSSDGTEILLELPAALPSELRGVEDGNEAPAKAIIREDVHVLVIEDDDDLREVLTLQLDRSFRIAQAANVDEAVAMAHDCRYDVVLCDVMMPCGGAETWLARSAAIDPQLDEHTILITGGPTTEAASALLETRGGRVLYKPFDISELRSLIERMARR